MAFDERGDELVEAAPTLWTPHLAVCFWRPHPAGWTEP